MKFLTKEEIKKQIYRNMNIVGEYTRKYWKIFLFVLCAFSILEVFLIVYLAIQYNTKKGNGILEIDYVEYLISYAFSLLISIVCIIFILLNRKHRMSNRKLAIALHIYAIFITLWSSFEAILDLRRGMGPIAHYGMMVFVGGILVISPMLFTLLIVSSTTMIIISNAINHYTYFNEKGSGLNMIIFFVIVLIMGFRSYRIYIKESIAMDELEELTYKDQLTGLLNERSYFMECESLTQQIEKKSNPKFGIFVMDVNNVKATNDVHGHRFGCHLIVTGGHKLPEIFKTSKIFHVGGDEYIAIIYGEDLEKMDETIKRFDETLQYQMIEFEGKEIILSLARGYAVYEEGLSYKEVFQKADNAMYENKVMVKEKYHLAKR